MDIKALVDGLCAQHGTHNPYMLAKNLGILVQYEPLGKIRGYYHRVYGKQFIHLNNALDEPHSMWVCCHELGHAILHPDINVHFCSEHTLFSADKFETQANRFAVCLMFGDEELLPYLHRPVGDAAQAMGVPHELAAYRLACIPLPVAPREKLTRSFM